jgi:predicted RNA binding protein YcfA (HicA-like mRNA interferase family)
MPKLRRPSGRDVIRIFSALSFNEVARRGSHVKLRRVLQDGTRQTLTVPDHPELDTGTTRAIYRQALRYITEDELHPHFYAE